MTTHSQTPQRAIYEFHALLQVLARFEQKSSVICGERRAEYNLKGTPCVRLDIASGNNVVVSCFEDKQCDSSFLVHQLNPSLHVYEKKDRS